MSEKTLGDRTGWNCRFSRKQMDWLPDWADRECRKHGITVKQGFTCHDFESTPTPEEASE